MEIVKLRAGQKVVIGETLVDSKFYKKGDVFKVISFIGNTKQADGINKRYGEFRRGRGIVLENKHVMLASEINWEATEEINSKGDK